MNKRRRSIRFKHGLMTASALSRAEGLTDDALLAIPRKDEATQKAAAATREDCRRPRPFVEPTVWRPSADLNRTARANTVVPPSWPHPDALARPRPGCPVQRVHRRCGQSAPAVMQAPRPGVPFTGTVPDRSSRFSGLAPRPIGDPTRRVSPRVPDQSRTSRRLHAVDCVDSGESWAGREHKGSTP
jgi:hypothetical protein